MTAKVSVWTLVGCLSSLVLASSAARAQDLAPAPPHANGAAPVACYSCPPTCCEPGYKIVEEIRYRTVCCKACRIVPDVKKTEKVLYACREECFCQQKCPGFSITLPHKSCGCGDECCAGCCESTVHKHCQPSCIRCGKMCAKHVLYKKFVTIEEPAYKCVACCVTKQVPYKVYLKVPCCDNTMP